MLMGRTKQITGLFAAIAAGFAAVVMGGCSNDGEQRSLVMENEALRAELAGERARREGAEAELGALESERAGLASELDTMRSQLSQSRTVPAGSRTTGFENIDGVTVGFGPGTRNEIRLDIANDILFDSGSATLKPAARRSLDRVADVIRQRYSGRIIRVEGHTDNDPIRRSNWKTNERLSSERAMAVEAYLVERGLNNSNVYTAAFGASRPKATKAASRRVEIVIVEPN